jgi:hypothetical protein
MLSPRIHWIIRLAAALRALGPYAAIELLVPGGTLIALAVWAFRNRSELMARVRQAGEQLAHGSSGHRGASGLGEATVDLNVGADHVLPTGALPPVR